MHATGILVTQLSYNYEEFHSSLTASVAAGYSNVEANDVLLIGHGAKRIRFIELVFLGRHSHEKAFSGCGRNNNSGAGRSRQCGGSGRAAIYEGASDGCCCLRLERLLHRHQRRRRFKPQVLGFCGCSRHFRCPGALVGEGCHTAVGGTIVGQIGYRWQTANWVFGFEGQGNWADFRGDNTSLAFGTDRNRSRIDSFGLITGQVGYAWSNVLFYVKGGAAVVGDKYQV